MKKVLSTLLLFALVIVTSSAQTTNIIEKRKIATKGYSEREVTPDIIYLSISLQEYYENGNTKKKVAIDILEKQLLDGALQNGVKKEDFTIQNIYSYNQDDKKKKPNELLLSRQYRIKVTNLQKLNDIIGAVDSYGLQNTSIDGYDHSNKKEIEKDLKTLAVKDARKNAEILASADGESVGKALYINDNSSFNFNDLMPRPQMYGMSKTALESSDIASGGADIQINIRPIKLTCQIEGVFELL